MNPECSVARLEINKITVPQKISLDDAKIAAK